MITAVGDELEIGIILARWRSLAGGFTAHGSLIAFWTVGAIVWSVFGARRSRSTFLDGLAKFQSMNLTSGITSWSVTAFYVCVVWLIIPWRHALLRAER